MIERQILIAPPQEANSSTLDRSGYNFGRAVLRAQRLLLLTRTVCVTWLTDGRTAVVTDAGRRL
jgi:hypothetical protein